MLCASTISQMPSTFMNRCVVDDQDRVGQWSFVHVWEQTLNECVKVIASNRLVEDLEVQYPIKGHCGKY